MTKRTTSVFLKNPKSFNKRVNWMSTKTKWMKRQICKKLQTSIFKFNNKKIISYKTNKFKIDLNKASIWWYSTYMTVTAVKKTILLFEMIIFFHKIAIKSFFKINLWIKIMCLFNSLMMKNNFNWILLFNWKTIIRNASTEKALRNWN